MAKFEHGNKFWLMRSKHGRDKAFTPETLLAGANEYFEYAISNPIRQQNWVGKDGVEVFREIPRAFTFAALELFLGIYSLRDYKKDPDFSQVVTHIEKIIYSQKFEHASAGIFNANIIARDLGLSDKVANHVTIEQPFFGKEEN
jgi:hypothetical protein